MECVRLNRMSQVKRYADEAKRIQGEALKLNKSTRTTSKRLDERVNGFHEQSITILGIFSAVVVGFMSGLSMFTSGFNKLTEVSLYIVSFYSVLVGIILFDILFMLIFFIAKISGHSIARDVPQSDKNWFFSTFHRYPYVYCFHFFAVAVLGRWSMERQVQKDSLLKWWQVVPVHKMFTNNPLKTAICGKR